MRKATHGYRIYENRDGIRIDCFKRSVSRYEIAKCRIFDLCRDVRLKHLEKRYFEVWDGIDAVSRVIVDRDGAYVEVPYLLPARTAKEQMEMDKDYMIATRNRLKMQKVGHVRGDITSWIKQGAGEKVLCRIIEKSSYVPGTKTLTRTFGRL